MKKSKLFLGLTAVGVFLTSTLAYGRELAIVKKGIINDIFHITQDSLGNSQRSAYAEADGSLTDKGWARMIKDAYQYCVEEEEQGAVMFKNDNNVLPLAETERNVTLFGRNSAHLMHRSGAGGASPNEKIVVHLDDAFETCGFHINKSVWDLYKSGNNQGVSSNSEIAVSSYTDSIKGTFADYSDAAIVTFTRFGTEDSDPSAGILDLQKNEKDLLKMIKEQKDAGVFKKVIVLLNSPSAMGMEFANNEEYGVDSVIWMGVPGYYSLTGLVHVLMGHDMNGKVVNPSGHAPDTFANFSMSSAAYQNFGNFSMSGSARGRGGTYVVYKEGIYVGYKYYETRYEDCVLGRGDANGSKGIYAGEENWNYADEMGYPFGWGMSYTTFEQKIEGAPKYNATTDQYEVTVTVKNTGNMDGRASVQLYAQAPYTVGGIEKSAIQLVGYDKVEVAKGKTEKVTIKFDRYFLASYDHQNKKQYVLEDGDYYFAIGNGAHEALNNVIAKKDASAHLVDHNGDDYTANDKGAVKVSISDAENAYKMSHYDEKVEVTNQFDDADLNYWKHDTAEEITYLTRSDWEGTFPTKMAKLTVTSEMNAELNNNRHKVSDTEYYTDGDGKNYNVQLKKDVLDEEGNVVLDEEGNAVQKEYTKSFLQMANVPFTGTYTDKDGIEHDADEEWKEFISQMSVADLAISMSDNRGIGAVSRVYKGSNSIAEGPEGLLAPYNYGDQDTHKWATGFATGPTFSATWDHEMQKKYGFFYGEDALHCGVACVNAPGANINRTPYGSRASEYMSEDGIFNYYIASNVVGEARKKGLIMNIKHCFLNNQETNRHGVSTFCNEQAIREIYLRPFEGALTRGEGMGIMTSYNRIGCTYAAVHSKLMLNVMRGEWKYQGLIIDDAQQGNNNDEYANGPMMCEAGTNVFCLDGGRGGQLTQYVTQNKDGGLLKKMQESNKYIMYALLRSYMGDGDPEEVDEETMKAMIYKQEHPWWLNVVNGICIGTYTITGLLAAAYVVFEVLEKKKGVIA